MTVREQTSTQAARSSPGTFGRLSARRPHPPRLFDDHAVRELVFTGLIVDHPRRRGFCSFDTCAKRPASIRIGARHYHLAIWIEEATHSTTSSTTSTERNPRGTAPRRGRVRRTGCEPSRVGDVEGHLGTGDSAKLNELWRLSGGSAAIWSRVSSRTRR